MDDDVTGALVEALRLARDGGARAERLSLGGDDLLGDDLLRNSSMFQPPTSEFPTAAPKLATGQPTDLLDLQVQLAGLTASIRALSEEEAHYTVPLQKRSASPSHSRDELMKEITLPPTISTSSSAPPMHLGANSNAEVIVTPSRSVLASPPPPPRPPMLRTHDQSSAKQLIPDKAAPLANYTRHLRQSSQRELLGNDRSSLDSHLHACKELEQKLRTPLLDARRTANAAEWPNPMLDRRRTSNSSNAVEGAPRFGHTDSLNAPRSFNDVGNNRHPAVAQNSHEQHDHAEDWLSDITSEFPEQHELPQWASAKKPKTPMLDKRSSLWLNAASSKSGGNAAAEHPTDEPTDMPPLSMPGAKKRALVESAPANTGPSLLQHMADSKALGVPMAVVGIDANEDGRADFLYVGADIDGDGIPDDLQEAGHEFSSHRSAERHDDVQEQDDARSKLLNAGTNCHRCKVLFLQVQALAQSLAGLGSIVFNWSSNLHTSHRHALARMVLQYTQPCSHIHESLQNVVEELRCLFGDEVVASDGKILESWQAPSDVQQSQDAVFAAVAATQYMPSPRGQPLSLGPGHVAGQRPASLATHAWSRNMACNDALTSEMTRDPLTGRLKIEAFGKEGKAVDQTKSSPLGAKRNVKIDEGAGDMIQHPGSAENGTVPPIADLELVNAQEQVMDEVQYDTTSMSPGMLEALDGFIDEYDQATASTVLESPMQRHQPSQPQRSSPRPGVQQPEEVLPTLPAHTKAQRDNQGDPAYRRGRNWNSDDIESFQQVVRPDNAGNISFYQAVQQTSNQRQNVVRTAQTSPSPRVTQIPEAPQEQSQKTRVGRLLQKAIRPNPDDSDESITGETQPKVWL